MSVQPGCPICLEVNADMCLPCGNYHWIHRTCWNSVVNKTICPVCRQNVIPALPLNPSNRSPSQTINEERKVQTPSRDFSYVVEVIRRINAWNMRHNITPDMGLDVILNIILAGMNLSRGDIDYVNRAQRFMLASPLEAEFSALSLRSSERRRPPIQWAMRTCEQCRTELLYDAFPPRGNICLGCKQKKKCLRCQHRLPAEAYDPRRRICRSCRAQNDS
jgi:hypothetical protein